MLFPMIWKKDDNANEMVTYDNAFNAIDKMMNEFWEAPFNGNLAKCFSGLKTDVIEKDGRYELEADLPGFNKEDIHVDVKDDVLTISAEHEEQASEKKDGKYIRRERGYSSYRRSFRVDGVKQDDITAAYKNGVLTVTVPKREALPEQDVKRIEVTD